MLGGAIVAFDILRTGAVGIQGSTGEVLGHSLIGLRDRLDRSLTEVRLTAGLARPETFAVAGFLEDLEVSAIIGARARKLRLTVTPIDAEVAVASDRQILSSIISNLLQNAFDYTVLTAMSGCTHARCRIACCSRSRTSAAGYRRTDATICSSNMQSKAMTAPGSGCAFAASNCSAVRSTFATETMAACSPSTCRGCWFDRLRRRRTWAGASPHLPVRPPDGGSS